MLLRSALRESLILVLLAAAPALFAFHRLNESAGEVSPGEVTLNDPRLPHEGFVWVDARPRSEYAEGHVTGAILLNEAEWDSQLADLFQAWQPPHPIIVYCDAGCHTSAKVAERLRELGLEPVYVLKGGYEAWKRSQNLPDHL